MYKLKEKHEINILAYCVMNNHTHILLESENLKDLSKYMQRLNTRYGQYYNKKYNRVGYVFRDRFKSEGIYNEEHLYNCIKYIYDNPVKAGLCKSPEQYPYSNYKKIDIDINKNFVFMDISEDKEKICEEVINEFLKENNLELIKLLKNKEKLKKLVIVLKDNYNLSFRQIAERVDIGRETLRKLYNSK